MASSTPTLSTFSSAASSTETVVSIPSDALPVSDPTVPSSRTRKSSAFWLSYAAVCLCTFVSALDITAIPTALPSMIKDLSGSAASSWVGSAYTLSSAALIPFTGNLANIFGRRPIILGSIIIFALGSVLAGTAQSMEWLIAARVVQGMGGGGMAGLSSIIVADLVPLSERGAYQGFKTMIFACAAGIGPVLGGALSEKYSWRVIFWINAPASAFAFLFVFVFLQVRAPAGDIWGKLVLVDWVGNALIIASTLLGNIALTWAGVRYAWSDIRVLAPLILSLTLMVVFVVYEKFIPRVPTMHWDVVSNRTALASLVATCFNGITSISIIYFLPLFFQAVFLASPLQSAVYSIPSAILISPFSFFNGLAVLKLQRYLPGNYTGWVVMVVGFGLVSILGADSSLVVRVVSQIIVAAGTGIVISSLTFPLMAPIPVERVGSALAFQSFLQTLSQTWGITISASILQNIVKRQFPARFIKQLPAGSQFAFAAVSRIAALPEPMQHEVKVAFGHGIDAIYQVMIVFAGLGFLCVFFMKEVPMRSNVDQTFALKDGRQQPDVEKVGEGENGQRLDVGEKGGLEVRVQPGEKV
ncbi:major facilitator superfamily domain-containing protein [Mycena alexandri]|uniref:Major facilitator superfamily domain-containing protein n=1 Tax=Mycena alexandri TaxID=1745969 RepID=A0AAD6WUU4_9AGAR|nr:major facilitator superfamily domain-containing protein [Mycena alexandri]